MNLEIGQRFVDSKYGCELSVEYFDDIVVLTKEIESGSNRLIDREKFSDKDEDEEQRFKPKQ